VSVAFIPECKLDTQGSDTSNPLDGKVAVVVGASGGIGRAITLALARRGAKLYVVGRDAVALAETVAVAREFSSVTDFQIDITEEQRLEPLTRHLQQEIGRVDILVHCADIVCESPMENARIEDLDLQYKTNVRAPYVLTQRLLPYLSAARGQIVFINSSVGLTAKRRDIGQYGATKHALRAIADSLREELNPKGIRVLTTYVGRTATDRQEALYRNSGRVYRPENLLQPDDVAHVVVHALSLPRTAEVTDISIRPMIRT
jgi:NADP-dependent 3-hydroxy acid dehydrogenase YdfG